MIVKKSKNPINLILEFKKTLITTPTESWLPPKLSTIKRKLWKSAAWLSVVSVSIFFNPCECLKTCGRRKGITLLLMFMITNSPWKHLKKFHDFTSKIDFY